MDENDPKKYEGFYGHGTEDSECEDEAFGAQSRKENIIAGMLLRSGSYTQTYGNNPLDNMDSMIKGYKREKSMKSHPVADVMKSISTDSYEISMRKADAMSGIRGIRSEYSERNHMMINVIGCIIIGLEMVFLSLIMNVSAITKANEMEKLMAVYTPVEGVAEHVSPAGRGSFWYLDITYKYEYGGNEYKGSCRTSRKKAEELGVYLGINKLSGKTITVYVDPEKPERSIFLPYPPPTLLSWILIPVGAGMVIGGVLYYHRRR